MRYDWFRKKNRCEHVEMFRWNIFRTFKITIISVVGTRPQRPQHAPPRWRVREVVKKHAPPRREGPGGCSLPTPPLDDPKIWRQPPGTQKNCKILRLLCVKKKYFRKITNFREKSCVFLKSLVIKNEFSVFYYVYFSYQVSQVKNTSVLSTIYEHFIEKCPLFVSLYTPPPSSK